MEIIIKKQFLVAPLLFFCRLKLYDLKNYLSRSHDGCQQYRRQTIKWFDDSYQIAI